MTDTLPLLQHPQKPSLPPPKHSQLRLRLHNLLPRPVPLPPQNPFQPHSLIPSNPPPHRLPTPPLHKHMHKVPHSPHIFRPPLKNPNLIRHARRPQFHNAQPQIDNGGEGYGREISARRGDGEEDLRGGGGVEGAVGYKVGVYDAVESVWIVGDGGREGDMLVFALIFCFGVGGMEWNGMGWVLMMMGERGKGKEGWGYRKL